MWGVVRKSALAAGAALATASCVFYQPIEPSLVWHPFSATAYCDYGFTASGVTYARVSSPGIRVSCRWAA